MPEIEKNPVPVLFDSDYGCCGCSACYAVCPAGAITMQANSEGFLYPEIDENRCIRCRRCLGVCAFKKDVAFRAERDAEK